MTKTEINLMVYDIYTNLDDKEGRGTTVYTKKSLHSREVEFEEIVKELVWVSIKLNGGGELLVGNTEAPTAMSSTMTNGQN